MSAKELWKIEDVAAYVGHSLSWVYKRTAPNTPFFPKIPRVQNINHPRFDPAVVRALFSATPPKAGAGSLKIKSTGNFHSNDTSAAQTNGKRRFQKL